MPACGPPRSLSPLKRTRSAPAAIPAETSGSPGRPKGARSTACPLPASSITARLCLRPELDQFRECDRFREAADAVVAGVDAHQRGGVRPDGAFVVAKRG